MPKYINADKLEEICRKHKYPSIPIDVFKQQPAADVVEVKHGKWIDGQCSECGSDIPAYIEDWHWKKDMNAKYCPICGADMRERKETNG